MSLYPSFNDREYDLLKKLVSNSADLAGAVAGDVSTISSLAGGVLVNGGTAAASGAIVLSIASALTGVNSRLSAAGQNATLGTGTSGTALTIASADNSLSYTATGAGTATFTLPGDFILTSSGNARLKIFTSAGNPYTWYLRSGGGGDQWSTGLDAADSNKYKISNSSSLGTSDRLTITVGGIVSTPIALSVSGTAYSFGALPSGATTTSPALTVPATTYTVTGTNTATAFQANYFGVPTFTNASAGVVTDLFNTVWAGPAAVAGSQTATRAHTLGVVDSTTASSAITGGLVVATTLGTTATSVGIGGGQIWTGGQVVVGTNLGLGGAPTSAQFHITNGATFSGANISAMRVSSDLRPSAAGTGAFWMVDGTIGTNSGNIASATGISVQTTVGSTNTSTDNFGIRILSFAGAATRTNQYGLKIEDSTGAGTLNYSYFSGVGLNRWGDTTDASAVGTAGNVFLGGVSVANGKALALGGKINFYNNIATTGWGGGGAIVATGSVVGASAAGNITNGAYTDGTAADGEYLISGNILVTAATAVSTSLNVAYTDESNVARTLIMPISGLAGTFVAGGLATSTGPFESAVLHIRTKASSTITFSVAAGTFTGVTYNARCCIRRIV